MSEQQEKTYGIKETKEAMILGFSLIGAIKVSKENDGKINVADLSNLVMVFPHFGAGIEGVEMIVLELKDLDESEAKELMTVAAEKLGETLSDDELVEKIEKSLKAVVAVYEAVKAW